MRSSISIGIGAFLPNQAAAVVLLLKTALASARWTGLPELLLCACADAKQSKVSQLGKVIIGLSGLQLQLRAIAERPLMNRKRGRYRIILKPSLRSLFSPQMKPEVITFASFFQNEKQLGNQANLVASDAQPC